MTLRKTLVAILKRMSLSIAFLGILSTSLQAMSDESESMSDEEIMKTFKLENKKVHGKLNKELTLSLNSGEITLVSNYNNKPLLRALKNQELVKWDLTIPCRSWRLYIGLKEYEEKFPSYGEMDFDEIFREDGGKKVSAALTIRHFRIPEHLQHQGIGRQVFTCCLEMIDSLPPQISHDIYITLGNSHPGVYKMYLESGFNYFVNKENVIVHSRNKKHDEGLLKRLSTEEDVPLSCTMKREPGGKRLYRPYFCHDSHEARP